jgi:hypothetical protein
MVILVAEAIARRNAKMVAAAMAGMVPALALVISLVYAKTGTFAIAITRDSRIDVFCWFQLPSCLNGRMRTGIILYSWHGSSSRSCSGAQTLKTTRQGS